MLEIASLLLKPDSSLWVLHLRLGSQSHHIGANSNRTSRGVFGDMLRIACSAFPAYRCVPISIVDGVCFVSCSGEREL